MARTRDVGRDAEVVVSVHVAGLGDPDFRDSVRRIFDLVAARAGGNHVWEAEFQRLSKWVLAGNLPRIIAAIHAGAFCVGVLTDNLAAEVREAGSLTPIDVNDVLAQVESAIERQGDESI
jgi:hypothetical protein